MAKFDGVMSKYDDLEDSTLEYFLENLAASMVDVAYLTDTVDFLDRLQAALRNMASASDFATRTSALRVRSQKQQLEAHKTLCEDLEARLKRLVDDLSHDRD